MSEHFNTEKNGSSSLDSSEQETISEPTSAGDGENARPACFKSTSQEILFVLTATMAIAMSSLLAGSVTVTSSFIGKALNMSTAEITWITSASSLSAGAFLLFFGRIADLFGRRTLFVGSLFLFAIFSLVAGLSKKPVPLDVLAGILGLFNASAVPPAVGLLGVCYETPNKRKNYAFACFSAGNPLGFAFGAVFGGIAATIFNWRASFWLMAITFLVFTVIGFFTVPQDSETREALSLESLKRFDWVGTFCIVLGFGMLSAALSLGETAPQGWKTGYVLALLVIGVLLLIAFAFWDTWYKYPLVPMHIWKNRNFSLALAIISLGFAAFTPGTFFLALYFQDVWLMSPLFVAIHLLPMFVVGLAVNVIAGLILHRVSSKTLMWIATASYTLGFLLLALNHRSSRYWAFAFPAQMLLVIAADFQFNVCNMVVMTSLPQSHQSVAGGIFQTAVRLTATLGFGIATALYNSVHRKSTLSTYWDKPTQPYTAIFWLSMGHSALSMCLVPFLTIGSQGGIRAIDSNATATKRQETAKDFG